MRYCWDQSSASVKPTKTYLLSRTFEFGSRMVSISLWGLLSKYPFFFLPFYHNPVKPFHNSESSLETPYSTALCSLFSWKRRVPTDFGSFRTDCGCVFLN
jgi:hypothetical protein